MFNGMFGGNKFNSADVIDIQVSLDNVMWVTAPGGSFTADFAEVLPGTWRYIRVVKTNSNGLAEVWAAL